MITHIAFVFVVFFTRKRDREKEERGDGSHFRQDDNFIKDFMSQHHDN